MLNGVCSWRLCGLILLSVSATTAARADTLISVSSPSAQAANDFVSWSKLGPDATLLGASFSAPLVVGIVPGTVTLAGANSVVSVVCAASPCSWKGSGFTAADSLLWTSDTGNSGNGPVTLAFTTPITGAGAMIQANAPGQFTAQVQAFDGATLLGAFTVLSDTNGDAIYIGIQDQTGANITKVVFSLIACGPLDLSSCTDFAMDTVNLNVGPAIAFLSTHALAFGVQPIGATSAPAPAALLNTGGAFMPISITTSGADSGDFSASPSSCANPLPPAAACLLSVTFKPTAGGPRKSSISISDSALDSPQTVILTGVGTAAGLSPTILPFAPQSVGTSSTAQTITLTNKGGVTMNLWQIAILGANAGDFSQTGSSCGSTLGAGVPCTISIVFKPTATGARSATVLFSDDGGGSPQAVTLTGTGI